MHGTSSVGRNHTRLPWCKVFRRFLLPQIIAILTLAGIGTGCGTTGGSLAEQPGTAPEEAEPILTSQQRQANAESFDKVWESVDKTFWDPEFGGTDWAAVRDTYRPLVAAATTRSEARRFMREALQQLGESHFYVIPAELYDDMQSGPKGNGDCGFRARVSEGRAFVVKVIPGSPGEEAGIKCGWELLTAGDCELEPFLKKLEAEYQSSLTLPSRLSNAAGGKLRGEVGEGLLLRFLDGEGKERVLELPLGEPQGHKTVFSNLPPGWIDIRTERLEGDIGYISLNIFMDPAFTMKELNKAMNSFEDCAGVILDLRGNGGGIAGMAPGVAGWFVSEKNLSLGRMFTRDSNINLLIRPRVNAYVGPLAVLVDCLSASTSEFLAAGLQDLGRARIFGTRSAGAALVANMIRLPNGDGFEYAFADYESIGGLRIEGTGISPDVEVPYSRKSLLKGEDPAMAAAIDWIRESH